jgi:hypothetical protein
MAQFAARISKLSAPTTGQESRPDTANGFDPSLAFFEGADTASLIIDEPEDNEESEMIGKEDSLKARRLLLSGELDLSLVDRMIASEIAKVDGFRSYSDQV